MDLGGNITLVGFSDRSFAELIVIKKVVGQYARKCNDSIEGFKHLRITLKSVGSSKVEIHAHIEIEGSHFASEVVHHNLFVALDSVLKKALAQAEHHQIK